MQTFRCIQEPVVLSALGESQQNLHLMRLMDEEFLNHPTHGVLQMQDFLMTLGFKVNEKRIRRMLRKMGVMAIYPGRNLSRLGQAKYLRPYLLRGLKIDRSNQVWEIDITYVAMDMKNTINSNILFMENRLLVRFIFFQNKYYILYWVSSFSPSLEFLA